MIHRIIKNLIFYVRRYFHYLPNRILRFLTGVVNLKFLPTSNKIASNNPLVFLGDILFLTFDIFGIAEIHEFIKSIFSRTRPLTQKERILAQEIFSDIIDLDQVRINDSMGKFYQKYCIAYVSFNTINYCETLTPETFIHEMTHVYQFQIFGSLYLFRALLAQAKSNTYDYGGIEQLHKVMIDQGHIFEFDFEQQAEIIEDFYKKRQFYQDQNHFVNSIYLYFYHQLLKHK